MPQALVPVISAIGSAVGGVVGASLIIYAGAYATVPAIIGTYTASKARR